MDHETYRNNLPLYAAAALAPDEAQALSEHLQQCESCRTALREYRSVWDGVGEALVSPDWQGHGDLRAQFAERLGAGTESKLEQVTPAPKPRQRRPWTPWAWVALALVALGGWATAYRSHQQLVASQALERFSASAHRVVLTPLHAAHGRVDLYVASGKAVVWVRHLPPPGPGHIYEGWWIVNGHPQPAGTFGTRPAFLAKPAQARAFAITIEPGHGTRRPTSPILASAKL